MKIYIANTPIGRPSCLRADVDELIELDDDSAAELLAIGAIELAESDDAADPEPDEKAPVPSPSLPSPAKPRAPRKPKASAK